jgi:hypothetical protein
MLKFRFEYLWERRLNFLSQSGLVDQVFARVGASQARPFLAAESVSG